jgi:hypothetical protein
MPVVLTFFRKGQRRIAKIEVVIARSGATWQSLSLKTRSLTEFILSSKIRFLTAFGMTGEGFGMTILNGLYIKIAQFRFHIRSSSVKGCASPIFIFMKSPCFGLRTRLYSSKMIMEGTRSIGEDPLRTHSVPIFFVEFDGGNALQSDFKSLMQTSSIFRESGINTGIAKKDLPSFISFLVKWTNNSSVSSTLKCRIETR